MTSPLLISVSTRPCLMGGKPKAAWIQSVAGAAPPGSGSTFFVRDSFGPSAACEPHWKQTAPIPAQGFIPLLISSLRPQVTSVAGRLDLAHQQQSSAFAFQGHRQFLFSEVHH